MLANNNCAPNGNDLDLLNYLEKHVTSLNKDLSSDLPSSELNSLQLYVLSDDYNYGDEKVDTKSFLDFNPHNFNDEYIAKKNLILVYQGNTIVLGMSTIEYAYSYDTKKWSRAYIQYVDTTGLFNPRELQSHVTKSLVKGYLSFCLNRLNVESVHLLATAKPAFLFAGSEFIEGKRALSAVKLINWWINLLQDFTQKNKNSKVFVYSPSEEVENSSRLKKRISKIVNWIYGLPYNLELPCVDQIPFFEDDPKWRHFQATILDDYDDNDGYGYDNDNVIIEDSKKSKSKSSKKLKIADAIDKTKVNCRINVKEFFESLQIRSEFRSEPSTFFVLKFPKKIQDNYIWPLSESNSKSSNLATFALKMLNNLTFETELSAKNSSQKISGWLKLMGIGGCKITEIEIENKINNDENNNSKHELVVNSLQSLIKKKINK